MMKMLTILKASYSDEVFRKALAEGQHWHGGCSCFFKQMDIAFSDNSPRDKALSKLNTLRQGTRSFNELAGPHGS